MASRKKSIASSGPNGGLPQIDTGVVNTLKKQGTQTVPLYQQCTAISSRLARLRDFPPYLELGRQAALANAVDSATATSSNPDLTTASGWLPASATTPTPGGTSSRRSVDPVQGLWDCLALGAPLCFVFNLLDIPSELKILNINLDPKEYKLQDTKFAKQCVAKFIIGLTKLRDNHGWTTLGELFTVGDLINEPRNTNGFVKVVSVLAQLIEKLPEEFFLEQDEEDDDEEEEQLEGDEKIRKMNSIRRQVIREILTTERSFVSELEILQEYATALRQKGIVSPDTVHKLLLNVNELLDAQRHFLISLEQCAEQKWPNQRWGNVFTENESLFVVYEPFCANFSAAMELSQAVAEQLMPLKNMINPRNELPAYLIKPIQRIMKYPLLLEELRKHIPEGSYPYMDELLAGLASAKRVADRLNEAERKSQNYLTCKALEKRVVDWKGHHISGFGPLKLDDLFTVTKSDVDRDYHVFLFDRIILCCKEAVSDGNDRNSVGGDKNKKGSILSKKNSSISPLPPPSMGAQAKKRTTPLLLKGRIFLSNVTHAVGQADKDIGRYGLEVWWRGDDELEFFTLRCRTEEQMKMWETNINALVYLETEKQKAEKALRAAERERQRLAGGNPGMNGRSSSSASIASRPSMSSMHMGSSNNTLPGGAGAPPVPGHQYAGQRLHYSHQPSARSDPQLQQQAYPQSAGPHARGPSISSTNGGGQRSKDLTKYFGASQIPTIAPMSSAANGRSGNNGLYDDEFDSLDVGEDRSPTRDEPTIRGSRYPRSTSALGGRITPGAGPSPSPTPYQQQQHRPALRSQFSSVRLTDAYTEQEQDAHEIALARARAATTGGQAALPHRQKSPSPPAMPMPLGAQSYGSQQQGAQRTRATSTPAQAQANAAMQRQQYPSPYGQVPPVPQHSQSMRYTTGAGARSNTGSSSITNTSLAGGWSSTASTTTTEEKRGSGSSQFSGESHGSSGYSTNDQGGSTSPLTPYGSSDSNLGSVLRQNKPSAMTPHMPYQQHQKQSSIASQHVSAQPSSSVTVAGLPPMKIKVHYRQDLFLIAVSRTIAYDDLADKVHKKIRLCGGDRAPDAALRIKYRDDDGDLISIGSDEDVQMAFDTELPMIALFVQ